jgi:hypothetical protein
MLEKQIEAVLKLLICWRDGGDCVMKSIDGVRCGNGLMWNHLIPQKQSHWLKLEIGNVFWGCGSHNMLDFHGDKTLALWFVKTFSVDALEALQAEARKHTGHKRTVQELEHLLDYYTELYQERYTAPDTIQGRMQAGYYGYIVRVSYPDNRKDFVR